MSDQPRERHRAVFLGMACAAGGAVVALATGTLLGWEFDITWLTTWPVSPRTTMNPMTACAFLLAGASLLLTIRRPRRGGRREIASQLCAGAVIAIGALKFLAYQIHIPIDTLLFPHKSALTPIAPNTAAGFLTVGLALLLIDRGAGTRTRQRPAIVMALLTVAVALLALTGYLYGVAAFYRISGFVSMAFNTAVAFMLLGLGILAARPEFEPIATLLSDSAGGVVARRLLPAAAILPLFFGWLCLLGGGHDPGQAPFRLTLYTLLITFIFFVLTWYNARFLMRLDIDRRRAERDAVEEHHLLRTLIDNLPDMVFVKDTEHRFLLNNDAHAKTLGASSPADMLGKSDVDFFPPHLSVQMRAEERQVVETGIPLLDKEQNLVNAAGKPFSVTVAKVPFRDTRGNVIGIVGIAHDTTLRKQVEEERDRFFTLSVDMICIAGFDGYFKRVNPAFETSLGYSADELTSAPWIDFVHPDDRAATLAEGSKLSHGAVTLYFENRYRCKDGSYRWLSWTAVPVVRDGRIYAVARDTTERRRVEEQLRETNRRLEEVVESERTAQRSLITAQSAMVQTEKLAGLGQMVAGVAHEINNPLSFVSNNVAVLQRDVRGMLLLLALYGQSDPLLEEQNPQLFSEIRDVADKMDLPYVVGNLQELLERSRDGLKRIQQIVKDLRDFARLGESDLQEAILNDGIQSTVTIVVGHAKKHGVVLKTELSDLPPLACHPAKINQVVMNLITNAIDACGPNGQVTIHTHAADDGNSVQIQVSDTGSGIDPAIRDRIFDPFFTTKPQGQGTGLGLSISYGIVHDHGGTIDLQSELGKGSTFTVTLPVKRKQ